MKRMFVYEENKLATIVHDPVQAKQIIRERLLSKKCHAIKFVHIMSQKWNWATSVKWDNVEKLLRKKGFRIV